MQRLPNVNSNANNPNNPQGTQIQQFNGDIHDSLCSRCFLLVLRVIFFLALSARFYLLLQINQSFLKVVLYLTNVGFIITFIFFSSALLDIVLKQILTNKATPKLEDIVAILFEVGLCIQVVVTFFYWGEGARQQNAWQYIKDVGIHGFPLLCLLVDFSINLIAFPCRHLITVMIVGITYMICNLIYSLSVKAIYTNISWKTGMSYVWVFVAFVIIAATHCLGQLIWAKCKRNAYQKQIQLKNSNIHIQMAQTYTLSQN